MKLSLQSKFAIGTIGLLLLFSAALAAFLDGMFHRTQRESEENRLKGLMYSLISSMDVSKDGKVEVDDLPEVIAEDKNIKVAIYDSNEEQVWGKDELALLRTSPPVGEWKYIHNWKQNHASILLFSLEWEGENDQKWLYTLKIRDSGESYRKAMSVFRKNLWTWLSLGCLVLLTLQLILLKVGFRPLKAVADEVALIEKGKQHKFEKSYPSELTPLTTNINSLLRHERGQQIRFQQALDNLAHALKTPLTAIKNLTMNKNPDLQLLKDLDEQVMRARDIVDYQLRKAATVGKNPFAEPVNLLSTVEKISRSIQKVYEQKKLQVKIQIPQEAAVQMDEGDLFEVLGNVIENAAKYCKSTIHIAYTDMLVIEDDGPGFSDKNIQSVVQRGVRQDQRTEGSGIGLSVVFEIISVFGGTLELTKSTNLGGACVKIKF